MKRPSRRLRSHYVVPIIMKRDLTNLQDLTTQEIHHLFELAADLKKNKEKGADHLKGKTIGLVFQKPSNRTRVSFDVGIKQLGGNCIYLGPDEILLGKRESTADVAKTLSRYLDGIVARTFSHKDVTDLAQHATVPVINGLSDLFHPCQALADIFSIKERFKKMEGLTLAYVGDGNNVCHSLLLGSAKVGINMKIATPKGYEPSEEMVTLAKSIAHKKTTQFTLTHSPQEAVKGAHIIYSDVWVSMGQEKESQKRLDIFKGYQINAALAGLADPDYIFMHCLPAHRGEEVSGDIIDGPHSIVFDQAENRLHAQKAILMFLLSHPNPLSGTGGHKHPNGHK